MATNRPITMSSSLKKDYKSADMPSLRSSVALMSGLGKGCSSAMPIPNFPSALFSFDQNSNHHEDGILSSASCDRSVNCGPTPCMADTGNEEVLIPKELEYSDRTYYHDETDASFHETNDLVKLMTLQSIDRLEHHLPKIVVDQIIDDMRKREEDAKNQKYLTLERENMNLEVPMNVAISDCDRSNTSCISSTIAMHNEHSLTKQQLQQCPKRQIRGRDVSGANSMSTLAQTLQSLDELLDGEFSSNDEDSSNSSTSSSSGSSLESSDACGSSSSNNSSSSEDVAEDEIDASCYDDDISDIGDSEHEEEDELLSVDKESQQQPLPLTTMNAYQSDLAPTKKHGRPLRRGTSFDNSVFSTDSASRSINGSIFSGGRVSSVGAGACRSNSGELEVGKLRQGRLNNRRLESDTASDDRSQSVDLATLSTKSGGANQSINTRVQSSHHLSAILFVDVSGFTKLSTSLEIEALSEIINNYFQMIVDEIQLCSGDILKFAGDALIVEWTQEMLPEGQKHLNVTLLAAICGTRLVNKCSDYPVNVNGQNSCTLNLHCALGYGEVVGVHCGDMDRMEYLILGDSIKQVADAMDLAKIGEVVASPKAVEMLGDSVSWKEPCEAGRHHTLAFKKDQTFQTKDWVQITETKRVPASGRCEDWTLQDLEDLQRRMSRYVHGVVYADEFCREELLAVATQRNLSSDRNCSNDKSKQTQPELRDVFTVFIQPVITWELNGEAACEEVTTSLLNTIMFIVNTEVTHHKAHLRQFIVDDKGLVVIANFGLRGSTFPNMVEERAIPFITNVRTLFKTELDLECSIGATYGKAYCGVVGGRQRHEYAILGPSVNLAARLMASSSNPGILVDEMVRQMSGDRPFTELLPVKAKGYNDLVKIYSPDKNIRKEWKDVSDEFVGRQEEIESLLATADSVVQAFFESKVVLVSGPYGIGKSYVLSYATKEIEKRCVAKQTPMHISRLVFCEEDSFRPFSIVRPLFLTLLRRKQHIPVFGDAETTGYAENLAQSAEVDEAKLYVALLQICLEVKIPMQYIEMFGGLIFSTKLADIGTWADRSRKMSEWNSIASYLVAAFIHCTAEYGIILLSLDDVSGMDEMSWKILQRLYEKASNLLVIGTTRTEFDLNINADFWADLNEEGIDSGRFRHLRMKPMILDDVSQLACKLLGTDASELDEAIPKTVSCQSQGNPLLAREIIGVMYTNTDIAKPVVSGAALSKIRELLLNRLDELSPTDRSHLNLGAILGFNFAEKDVVAVMEKYNNVAERDKTSHARDVRSSLKDSVEYGILKCTEEVDGSLFYQFAHALWMETITLHILDSWKDEMRAMIVEASNDGCISVKYDWEEIARVRANFKAMHQKHDGIQETIKELRSLINGPRCDPGRWS